MKWIIKPLGQYAEFRGRSARREVIVFFTLQILLLVAIVNFIRIVASNDEVAQSISQPVIFLFVILFATPNVALSVRRLHDQDKPWWFIIFCAIPFIGWIFWLFLMLTPGTVGPNNYGDDPNDFSVVNVDLA